MWSIKRGSDLKMVIPSPLYPEFQLGKKKKKKKLVMGNCQAVDTATLAIQHPCGKVEKLYWSVTASDIMKANPGHFVALLITTTLYHPSLPISQNTKNKPTTSENTSLRVTKVKLLRPTDTLTLGHVYRLITNQEVMKGLVAKKQAKLKNNGIELADKGDDAFKDIEKTARRYQLGNKNHQGTRQERQRSRTAGAGDGSTAKSKAWQPSLNSISEAGS